MFLQGDHRYGKQHGFPQRTSIYMFDGHLIFTREQKMWIETVIPFGEGSN